MFVILVDNSTINFLLIYLFAAVMIFTVQGMPSITGVLCNRPEHLFVMISLLDSYFCRLKNLQMFLSPPVDRKSWILILFPQFTYNWLFFLHLPKIILNIVLDPKLKYMWLIRSIFDGQMIFWMSTLLPPGLERAFAQSLVEL